LGIIRNKMTGKCKLCEKNTSLKQSHIVPKFIFKWLRDTSATGYFRFGENPNKRAQDGFKEYLLCGDCEAVLNKWETEFATNVFHPLVTGSNNYFEYGSWFLKFVVSLSWRSLLYFKKFGLSHFTESQINEVEQALEVWRKFLLGENKYLEKYQQHVLPIDIVSELFIPGLPANINRYFLTGIDIDPIANNQQALVYVHIPYFIFFGGIQIRPELWENTIIDVNKGTIGINKCIIPQSIADYVIDKAKEVGRIGGSLSERQKSKVEKIIRNDLNKTINSKTFKSMRADVKLFGEEAFE